jgi:hypothetical protein
MPRQRQQPHRARGIWPRRQVDVQSFAPWAEHCTGVIQPTGGAHRGLLALARGEPSRLTDQQRTCLVDHRLHAGRQA